jgi:epoxyqueuosine reductase
MEVSPAPSATPASPDDPLPLSAAQLSATAKRLAIEHGFPLHGIARVPSGERAGTPRGSSFGAWLQNGFHGPLDYMQYNHDVRADLRQRLSWARSIMALGAFYDGSEQGTPGKNLSAHIARYARGRDYHRIFEVRLKKLSIALALAGVCRQSRYYIDTGPVLERAWAEAAGIGWIGKNTCLIHPRLGSFFLLCEIVLDAELEPDAPHAPHCGTCTRCLDACPTQAFPAPGVLDANKCLVTWNIEMRGETPPELWKQQGGWIAGCDICQTVCPYNSPSRQPEPDAELSAPLPWTKMTLAQCITMDADTFDHAFKGSALRRSSLKGLRLGAITAAGNTRAADCRTALASAKKDVDPQICERAEWALAQWNNVG